MSRGQPRLRNQTPRRVLERCQNKSNAEGAIIIDDDLENADVVLIDNPSTSNVGSKNAITTKLNCLPRCVIYIDDEEEEPSNLSGDPSGNQFDDTFNNSSLSGDPDSDDCVMFTGNGNARCNSSGPSRNHFGLYIDTESSTTESTNLNSGTYDCEEFEGSSSDCEIMLDHSGNIREHWERAASKKEGGPFTSVQATASTPVYTEGPSHEPILQNVDVGNCFENFSSNHFEEMLAEFDLRSPNDAEQSPSIAVHSADDCQRTTVNIAVPQSRLNIHIPCEEPGNWWKDDYSNPSELPQAAYSKDDRFSLNDDAEEPVKDSSFTYQNHGTAWFSGKEEPSTKTSCDSPTLERKQVSKVSVVFHESVEQEDDISYNRQSGNEMVAEQEIADFREKNKEDSDELSPLCRQHYEETLIHAEGSTDTGVTVNNNIGQVETSDVMPTSYNESDTSDCYENLIGEREKHKKTDQYKRVAEEEWASRQQQLQIQAEEAQRMRRRRKAEKVRLLDMEKRQKQRLQEIHDLHKKDEETTQLKERIRVEVRRDLERVEINCRDMTSVLRVLGIDVKGGVIPMVHEINAAYKQALLRFHPDRASRTDIRQQVEAEEKFKLISRLKEKLLF